MSKEKINNKLKGLISHYSYWVGRATQCDQTEGAEYFLRCLVRCMELAQKIQIRMA